MIELHYMSTDSFVFFITSIKRSYNDIKQFGKNRELSEIESAEEPHSKDRLKTTGKMKFESSPETETSTSYEKKNHQIQI